MSSTVNWDGDPATLLALDPLAPDQFRNRSSVLSHDDRLFGGQLIGHCLAAAMATAPGRLPHSAHLYFIGNGAASRPIEFRVERTRDGGRTSLRQVEGWQDDRRLVRMACSLRGPGQAGPAHQLGPGEVPPPEACESYRAFAARSGDDMAAQILARIEGLQAPVEMRVIDEAVPLRQSTPPRRRFWFRLDRRVEGDGALVHMPLLAYLSDYWMAAVAVNPHLAGCEVYPLMLSLDHALWFHREARADDWLLYDLDSPGLADGTAIVRGTIYDRQGRLVASVAQEALISLVKAG